MLHNFTLRYPREEWVPNAHDEKWKDFLVRYTRPGEIPEPDYVTRHDGCYPKRLFTDVMIFYPTEEMMTDFERFIAFLFDRGAHIAGGCKIIPYPGYQPNKNSFKEVDSIVWKCWRQSASFPPFTKRQKNTDPKNAYLVKFDDPLDATTEEFYDRCKKL
jgi:hypothetical protein